MSGYKPGALSDEERDCRRMPRVEPVWHLCLGCRRLQDEEDMIFRDGWFCGDECQIELLRRLIRVARRTCIEQVRELRHEIGEIKKGMR